MELESRIITLIIEHKFLPLGTELVVLEQFAVERADEKMQEYLVKNMQGAAQETVADYLKKSSNPGTVEPGFALPAPVTVLSKSAAEVVFSTDGWDEFYRRFPGAPGWIEVSRVGFDSERRQALACVGIQKGPRDGFGSYFLLEKDSEDWVIRQVREAWRS